MLINLTREQRDLLKQAMAILDQALPPDKFDVVVVFSDPVAFELITRMQPPTVKKYLSDTVKSMTGDGGAVPLEDREVLQ